MRLHRLLLSAFLTVPLSAFATPAGQPPIARRLHVDAGPNVSDFVQNDKLTMHTIVRTNGSPRVMFATPAGNSGVGLWFKPVAGRGLTVEHEASAIEVNGRAGVQVTLHGPSRLEVDRVMLDSMRALRDRDHNAEASRDALVKDALRLFQSPEGHAAGATPEMIERLASWVEPKQVTDPTRPDVVILERAAFGSGARYRVEIAPDTGTHVTRTNGQIVITSATETRFTLRSFIERAPLEPLAHVLTAPKDSAQERNLGLLVYKDKFLAGSYQYLTYFGRDTMISSKLLAERLTPEALGTAVGSVLDRVSVQGRVAHEESNGDQATLEALPKLMKDVAAGKTKLTIEKLAGLEHAIYDYKMMDGEFLLPPLLADYAARAAPDDLRATLSPARMKSLAKVVTRVLDETSTWRGGSVSDLVHLRRGQIVGNWRDSGEGLGNGRTPLDVNAYLVPAALEAVSTLLEQPGFPKEALLEKLGPAQRAALARPSLAARRAAWKSAVQKFEVVLDNKAATARISDYLASYSPAERAVLGAQTLWSGKTIDEALKSGAPELASVRFPGVSLDARGKPTPVLSSDEAFSLFYGNPDKDELMRTVTRIFQPFPVGLMTEVGMVVANPAYSNRAGDHALFDRSHYHGAVVWSWPQTMMRRGLEKQLARFAGDQDVTAVLQRGLTTLDAAQKNTSALQAAELWTWSVDKGHVVPVAFGASAKDTTEGAALQLWSNTY